MEDCNLKRFACVDCVNNLMFVLLEFVYFNFIQKLLIYVMQCCKYCIGKNEIVFELESFMWEILNFN